MHHAALPVDHALAICGARLPSHIAACVFGLNKAASREVQLLPKGEFRARDGRPSDAPAWKIDRAIAERLIADLAQRANRMVIDFEHQTLLSESNGQPAPAAAWFKQLEWREESGLWATDVEWTARARAMIEAGEYAYLSPVFAYDTTNGAVTQLFNAALTNTPALDGMAAVMARAAAKFNAHSHQENHTMTPLLKAVLAALKLPETTTEDDAVAGIAALKARADGADAEKAALNTEIAALKTQSAKPDPAKYAPVEAMTALQTEVAALRAQNVEREVSEAVTAALAEGKLLPAQEVWARDLGKSNLAALKTYIATAQPIAALNGLQSGGRKPGGTGGAGDSMAVATAALKYQREQTAAGNNITTAQAVAHVSKGA